MQSSSQTQIDSSMSPRKIGPFEVERQIGIGGMGIVYSAIYPENGRKVALKVLSPGLTMDRKLVKRFEREIEILKRMDHPNIVKYYGGGLDQGQRYYAMEFIDGGSLQDKLKKRGRLSWEQAIQVGRQVSSALEHAHNAGIIHRDLKPANLFLSKKGRLKLGDFGIARDTEATALTAMGKTVGTYAYMAPEQIQASHPIAGKTDLYALGCLLYEVIVGETPFLADTSNPMDMLMQHLNDAPYNVCEKVPDCPVQLDSLIERLLEKNPDDRPHDALAVHTQLGEIRDAVTLGHTSALSPADVETKSAGVKANTASASPKKKKKRKKKKKDVPFHERTSFLVACMLALAFATYWLLRPKPPQWYVDNWRTLMKGDEYEQREALEKYLDPFLEQFFDHEAADEAREYSDEVHADILETPLKHLAGRLDKIEDPFKAKCAEAIKLEDEEGLVFQIKWDRSPTSTQDSPPLSANPLPAIQRWHRLLEEAETLDRSDREFDYLRTVCEHHFDYFRRALNQSDDGERYLHKFLEDLEAIYSGGEVDEAKASWKFINEVFGKVERFKKLTEYARRRFGGIELPLPIIPPET